MNQINIVMLEDDKDAIESFKFAAEKYAEIKNQPIKIVSFEKDTLEYYQYLFSNRCDSIIVDIALKKYDGNEIIEKLYESKRIPIVAFTGNVDKIDKRFVESDMFKIFDRMTTIFDNILQHIYEVYKTGYTVALSANGRLDNFIQKTYNNYYSSFKSENNDSDSILRVFSALISQEYSFSDESSAEIKINETYLIDRNRKKLSSGELYKYLDEFYCVINPPCDLERANGLDYITLCSVNLRKYEIDIIKPIINSYEILDDPEKLVQKKKNLERDLNKTFNDINQVRIHIEKKLKEKITRYTHNSKDRYHLLPQFKSFPGGLVDFQHIKSIHKKDFEENSPEYIITITPSIYKNIISRLSNYYSRLGQLDFSVGNIIDKHRKS